QQPVLQLQDAGGNPVGEAGVVLTATVASGPAGAALANASATTNASGVASFGGLTLTGTVGSYTLSFGASPLTPATSGTITLSAGAAATIAVGAGNDQSAVAGTAVAIPPAAVVTDARGNPVSGVRVDWQAATGGGSVNPTSSTTDVNGHATTTRTLGVVPGTQTTTATATLSGGPTTVTFTITATIAGASRMTKTGGDLQKDTVGAPLPVPLSVKVT